MALCGGGRRRGRCGRCVRGALFRAEDGDERLLLAGGDVAGAERRLLPQTAVRRRRERREARRARSGGCGAASARPATRLGSPAIGATRPTSAPLRLNTGPPPALLSTAAVTTGARLAAGERGRACGKARSGEPEDDEILRRRAEAGRSAVRGEISGEHGQACCGVGALDPHRLAGDGRIRAVVGFKRGQRLAGRDDKRSRGGLGSGRRGGSRRGRRGGDSLAGAAADSGNGSNELAMAIAIRSRVAVWDAG